MKPMSEKPNNFVMLAGINVNDKIEKKQNLSYLSWAWAVDQLMRADPDANWSYGEPSLYAGETMMVHCTVTAFGKAMSAHLPVMDHRNQPIPKPNAFQVNTAMQRCLVKAIALHGLGLYIYAGEDLPEGEPHAATRPGDGTGKITPAAGYWESTPIDVQNAMLDLAHRVKTLIKRKDIKGAFDELNADTLLKHDDGAQNVDRWTAFWTRMESDERSALKKEGDRRKSPKHADEKEAA